MHVNIGTEGNTLFLNLTQSRQGKDLKSTGICQDRLIPGHELVKSAHLFDDPITGSDMQMVGVG